MAKRKEDWQNEATEFGIDLTKEVDGTEADKTIEELKTEIEAKADESPEVSSAPSEEDSLGKAGADPLENFSSLGKSGKKEKVEFLASPTGLLKLGYNAGEVASFTKGQAEFLYDLGIAKKA